VSVILVGIQGDPGTTTMLGWEVFVYRRGKSDPGEGLLVGRWMTGLFGLGWLHDLVKAQEAIDLGGNGYPCRFSIPAAKFMSAMANGPPPHDSPPVIGQNYALPAGFNSEPGLDLAALAECADDETLIIEAWDQS
jgi:hypothetical protein